MSVLEFALASMLLLAPKQDHSVMSHAIAEVVDSEKPLFANDEEKLRTTALVVAVAFREGSLKPSVVGDCDESKPGEKCKGRANSFCTMQISRTMGGSEVLNENPALCIKRGLEILRISARICPNSPVSWYAAGGEDACSNGRAQRISIDRVNLAHWLWLKRPKET